MKNTIIRKIEKSNKKQVLLTGILSLPLRVGERAWIRQTNQCITTSTVEKIWEVSEDCIVFETCNTIYQLQYERFPIGMAAEVMCA
ncbi:MAG: hypothetical protein Q4D16_10730 [Eubacteriales bacterium]|nr:hypothetical protein [Eubacteriales bacterium]